MRKKRKILGWLLAAGLLAACGDSGERTPPKSPEEPQKILDREGEDGREKIREETERIFGDAPATERPAVEARSKMTLSIEGMTCEHCVEAIGHAIELCAGVARVDVSLEQNHAVVTGDGMDVAALRRAVEAMGYKITKVDGPVPLGK